MHDRVQPGDEFRQRRIRSWLDESFSRVLARQLTERLLDRCRGERGLLVTLTYRRDEYESARDLWRAQSDDQHVPLFMRRLGRAIGEDLRGRWIAKAEFQEGGWVHFHVVLLGVERIEHEVIERTWGHGFVWVNRLTQSRLRYACKYVAKAGGIPAFLYASRRVTLIRTSTGFWLDGDESEEPERAPRPEVPPSVGYIPIGERIARAARQTVVRDEWGRWRTIHRPVWDIVRELVQGRCGLTRRGAWLSSVREPAERRSRPRAPAVHLTRVQEPDACSWSWLDDVLMEALT